MEKMFYLAELIGSLNKVCIAFAIIFSMAMAIGWIGRIISNCGSDYTEVIREFLNYYQNMLLYLE